MIIKRITSATPGKTPIHPYSKKHPHAFLNFAKNVPSQKRFKETLIMNPRSNSFFRFFVYEF